MDADSLFGLPLDEFIPQRTALAKSLRAEGRRDEAAEVAAARKPSVAAWAVNQLVRTQAGAVAELFDAGDALRATQEQVLEGRGDGRTLRAAAERERVAVQELVKTARGLLTSEGHGLSDVVVARVDETLHAAALDEDAREQVRAGCLQRELRHVGFGAGLGASPTGPGPAPPKRATKTNIKTKTKTKTDAKASAAPTPRSEPDPGARERRKQERREHERAERERAAAVRAARITESETRRAAERAE
ncbi:MAG TPA: hypothetical protein VGL51_17840, partial [Solirubrobacteraceae bacterium]